VFTEAIGIIIRKMAKVFNKDPIIKNTKESGITESNVVKVEWSVKMKLYIKGNSKIIFLMGMVNFRIIGTFIKEFSKKESNKMVKPTLLINQAKFLKDKFRIIKKYKEHSHTQMEINILGHLLTKKNKDKVYTIMPQEMFTKVTLKTEKKKELVH
jgi:hypothetical protein